MSKEIGEVTQQQTESNDAHEATAAAAAFAISRGDAPPEPVVETAKEDKQVQQEDKKPEQPAIVLAGMTEAQIAELLGEIPKYRKQIDNLAGNNGKLNAAIQKLQQDTPRGEAVTVTDEDLAEMQDAYPDLANLTKGALNKILGRLNTKGTGAVQTPDDYIALATKAAKDVATSERVNTHVELLHGLNPGWDAVIGLPDAEGKFPDTEYRRWLASQPAEYKERIENSNNAFEIGSSITKFNEAKEASSKKQQQNKQRLANAVQPEGQVAARGVISEQSAADKAFNARRQRT